MEFKCYILGFFHHEGEGRLDTREAQVRRARGYFEDLRNICQSVEGLDRESVWMS